MSTLLDQLVEYQQQGLSAKAIVLKLQAEYGQQLQQAEWLNDQFNLAHSQQLLADELLFSLRSLLFPQHQDETVLDAFSDVSENTLIDSYDRFSDTLASSTTAATKTVSQDDVTHLSTKAVDATVLNDTESLALPSQDATIVKQSDVTQISSSHTATMSEVTQLRVSVSSGPKLQTRKESTRSELTDKTVFNPRHKKQANANLDKGSMIKNRFILVQDIGQGGMGTVFKARDLRKEEMHDDSPFVAIKFLNDDLRDRHDALVALQREAVKSQALAHPNIVTVYDFDRDGDLVYISMEYLDGQTLDRVIESRYCSRLPVQKVMRMIEFIARGLAYAHQTGFAHADLKPGNIFLTSDGNIKVLDFGIAQAVRGVNDHTPVKDSYFDVYSLGAITPNYASLEMIEGEIPTPADDLYSLGCVAYALLTGSHPFVDEKGKKISAKEAQRRGMDVKTIPNISRRQMAAIRKCLQFEREQRFQNAGEFIDAIKPPVKLRRWVLALLIGLSITVLVSWWITLEQSNVALTLSDLPDEMSSLVETIETADQIFASGDIDQSHKLYSQAWEISFELEGINQRDQYKLKLIIDRRIDNISKFLIEETKKPDLDEFRLFQLQVALEFLKQGDLGRMDSEIEKALKELDVRIKTISPVSQ